MWGGKRSSDGLGSLAGRLSGHVPDRHLVERSAERRAVNSRVMLTLPSRGKLECIDYVLGYMVQGNACMQVDKDMQPVQ